MYRYVFVHVHVDSDADVSYYVDVYVCVNEDASVYITLSLHVFRQFHRLQFVFGQMNNVTAIDVVKVLSDVCAGRLLLPTKGCETNFKHDSHNASLLDFSNIVEMASSH